ncbi:MAG: LysM peptidoglycan-binding domain-containing protein [Gammaproteobacteria bacterium]
MRKHNILKFNKLCFLTLVSAIALQGCAGSAPTPEPAPVAAAPAPTPVVTATPPPAVESKPVAVRPDYPSRYVVKKGDTLWDISSRFLNDPWMWPEVWHINPEIRNPHLIYPGDVIALHYVDGKPYITLEGAGGMPLAKPGMKTVKLSPEMRVESLERAIPTIPREAISPFLDSARIVTEEDIKSAAYVVSSYEEHLISGPGYKIYGRNIQDPNIGAYHIVRPGDVYRDPVTDKILGYEVKDIADAHVLRGGDPVTLRVKEARKEVLNGDLLLPFAERNLDFTFFPRAPDRPIDGQIISVFKGVSMIGQYNVVVLNRGTAAGLKPGHVLAVYQKGARIRDTTVFENIDLPDERAGLLMVFQSFDTVSYALVMEAINTMSLLDRVTNP